jgi:hypothetical protein
MDTFERYNRGGAGYGPKSPELPPPCERLNELPKPLQRLVELEKLHGSIHEALYTLRNKLKPVMLLETSVCPADCNKSPKPITSALNESIDVRIGQATEILSNVHDIIQSLDL